MSIPTKDWRAVVRDEQLRALGLVPRPPAEPARSSDEIGQYLERGWDRIAAQSRVERIEVHIHNAPPGHHLHLHL